jgi:hypothetical protein
MTINFTDNMIAGFLPDFFDENDPRSAPEQFDASYAHGGGLQTFDGFEIVEKDGTYTLIYPGDSPLTEVSRATLHGKPIILFDYAWLLMFGADDRPVVARAD